MRRGLSGRCLRRVWEERVGIHRAREIARLIREGETIAQVVVEIDAAVGNVRPAPLIEAKVIAVAQRQFALLGTADSARVNVEAGKFFDLATVDHDRNGEIPGVVCMEYARPDEDAA